MTVTSKIADAAGSVKAMQKYNEEKMKEQEEQRQKQEEMAEKRKVENEQKAQAKEERKKRKLEQRSNAFFSKLRKGKSSNLFPLTQFCLYRDARDRSATQETRHTKRQEGQL